ncbi:MAG TPA: cupin domain-containing protein [Prolixibacteraceae bacterium]|jgi:mannose-6-phosphate isomerase-like protein (cupin superfamily)
MEEQIKQIADRLRGMREVLEISPDAAAVTCAISTEQYLKFESGQIDIPVSILHRMAQKYNFDITSLLTGEEPLMHSYTLTRKDKGVSVDRQKAYKYQALAGNFRHRRADPFIVVVDPKEDATVSFNSHPGQEFNFMIEGKLKIFIGSKEMILEPGDSIYFDSGTPHGMLAMENKPAKFLAIIL